MLILMLGIASPAIAHHSYSAFDASRTVTLEGSVVSFQWSNPHSWLQVLAPGPTHAPVTWDLETMGPAVLAQRGILPKTLKPGDKVQVIMNPRRDGSNGGGLVRVTLADGRVLVFR